MTVFGHEVSIINYRRNGLNLKFLRQNITGLKSLGDTAEV